MNPTAAKKSRGSSVGFFLIQKRLKIKHIPSPQVTVWALLPLVHLCVFFSGQVQPSALVGPSLPPSLAYLAFLQGLGSTGAFHSHSRLFPLEKAKFLFCTTKRNAVKSVITIFLVITFLSSSFAELRSHNLVHFNFYSRHNPQVCPKSYLSGISGFL